LFIVYAGEKIGVSCNLEFSKEHIGF